MCLRFHCFTFGKIFWIANFLFCHICSTKTCVLFKIKILVCCIACFVFFFCLLIVCETCAIIQWFALTARFKLLLGVRRVSVWIYVFRVTNSGKREELGRNWVSIAGRQPLTTRQRTTLILRSACCTNDTSAGHFCRGGWAVQSGNRAVWAVWDGGGGGGWQLHRAWVKRAAWLRRDGLAKASSLR